MKLLTFVSSILGLAGMILMSNVFAGEETFDSPENCYEVRLDRHGPYAKLPVYNQKLGSERDPDICYAVTASQLIDAHHLRYDRSMETLTSPLSVALKLRLIDSQSPDQKRSLTYDDSDPMTFMVSGGSILGALKAIKGEEVCDQVQLDQEIKLIQEHPTARTVDVFLQGLVADEVTQEPLSADLIRLAIKEVHRRCSDRLQRIDFPNPETLTPPGGDFVTAQAELIGRLSDLELSPSERKKLVEDFQRRFDPEYKIRFFGTAINSLLSHPMSTGIGIGYLYQALGPENRSVGGHASVIIGRRYNHVQKSCEYLVRDSYGPLCKNREGRPRYELPCENGSVWVSARRLLKETMDLTWIPPR